MQSEYIETSASINNDILTFPKLLWAENIGKDYHTGEITVHALQNASLEIRQGEILCILGPSGSGKSTLLNILGGIDTPDTGKIFFHDEEITKYTERQMTEYRRHRIGFIFQFYNLIPNLTARENVELATQISTMPLNTMEVLSWVNLTERAEHFPSQLSGGEQQRVAIARAVAKNPDILLCDEPTGALDYETGKLVLRTLLNINQKIGKTIAIITHNAAISQMSHRTIRMRSGCIVEVIENMNPVQPEDISW